MTVYEGKTMDYIKVKDLLLTEEEISLLSVDELEQYREEVEYLRKEGMI